MNSLDLKNTSPTDWRSLPPDERKRALFRKQKDLLDTFLSRGAIDRRQYEKSLTCMAENMEIERDEGKNAETGTPNHSESELQHT